MPGLLSGHSSILRCRVTHAIREFSHSPRSYFLPPVDRIRDKVSKFIVHSRTTDPFVNLAIEDQLLKSSDPQTHILFTYVNRPCVVIGRNQNPWVEVNLAALKDGIPHPAQTTQQGAARQEVLLVRRRSGGGAVFHDEGNLNYSFIVPNDKNFNRDKHARMVVEAIQSISSELTSHGKQLLPPALKNGIRINERHDIVMPARDGHSDLSTKQDGSQVKMSGSAYKLTRGRALHHGTLLFSSPNIATIGYFLRSPARAYIDAKGVESVRSPIGNLRFSPDLSTREDLRTNLENRIATVFQDTYQDDSSSTSTAVVGDSDITSDDQITRTIMELKSPEWKYLQTPTFTLTWPPPHPDPDPGPGTETKPTTTISSSSISLSPSTKILLKAQHGLIIDSHISISDDPIIAEAQAHRLRSALHNRKLHDVTRDWKSLISGAMEDQQDRHLWTQDQDRRTDPASDSASAAAAAAAAASLVAWLEKMLPPCVPLVRKC